MVHADAYYPLVREPSESDGRLTEVATDLIRVFHGMAREVPPSPARDLTMGQIRLLFLLQREGAQPMGRVAEVFELSSTASSGFVARIERHGLISRAHRSDDRRIVECDLTQAGRRFVEDLSGVRIDVIRQALAALEPPELTEFQGLLRRILERRQRPVSPGDRA